MEAGSISFDLYHPKPLLIVISGPSGVGKDAALRVLQRRKNNMHFVVTTTSRKKRENEVEGVDYVFISEEQFEGMITRDEFLEHALVYDDYKGIPKRQVREALRTGKDVIMRLDVQGAATIRRLYPEVVSIFLIPANQEEWMKRLIERHSETTESMKRRVTAAREELNRIPEFDYVVVNAQNCLEEAVDSIEAIIKAEHHRVVQRSIQL